MEPRFSLSIFTVAVLAGLCSLAARGFAIAAIAVGLFIVAIAAGLDAGYVARRRGERLRPHRRALDRIVRAQWAVIGLVAFLAAALAKLGGVTPLEHAPPLIAAIVIGLVVAASAVYLSSLVDWYWILPRVSGLMGPGPCECPGQERWAGITSVWLFHRAGATFIVIGVLAGVPGYLASTSHSGGGATVCVLVGAALAIAYSKVNEGVLTAFSLAFNPPIHVGDLISVQNSRSELHLVDAYTVDISIQGLKFKVLQRDPDAEPRFWQKGRMLAIQEVAGTPRDEMATAVCEGPDRCQAVNWYCHRNPLAHGRLSDDRQPVAPIP